MALGLLCVIPRRPNHTRLHPTNAPPPHGSRSNFADRYCALHEIAPQRFPDVILQACLHRPARFFRGPILLLLPEFFAADLELINHAALITREGDLELDIEALTYHPYNQSSLRRLCRLCIDPDRLRRLVHVTFDLPEPEADAPLPKVSSPTG